MRILVVEDDLKVANALREGLEIERYEVTVESTGDSGFMRMTTEPFDLLILDLVLPDRNGLEILTSLRARCVRSPILVLTGRDSVHDRVMGLDSGADDYLVKPFAFAELIARVRTLVRGDGVRSAQLRVDDVSMDLLTRQVTRSAEPIRLTVREFALLEQLMRHEGQVVSREALARDVWQEPARTALLYNIIDVHIGRLRKKIEPIGSIKLIHTVRGVGFTMSADRSASAGGSGLSRQRFPSAAH
jgi:two-component system copper resistance phosphate regulon response regulator CusR